MTTPEPLTNVARLSDAERDQAIELLRDHSVQGRLSHETFMRRIDLVLHARGRAELDALTSDLPSQGRFARLLVGSVRAVSSFGLRLQSAWRHPRLDSITLPASGPERLRIGRQEGCDLRLNDTSISRVHAELSGDGAGGWLLHDLGSTNGTQVNGSRIIGTVAVRPGDRVVFGNAAFRLIAR
ncbi:DUF1707 and FHA domain-containing protein [Streptacidiphilus sp. P02-A3a]|uniref:DUF1707 and FHA domain-containing protein n=1 Tax=Streptacidiphilus sp. P02-A3a TaxID=2704468 RepID=UPI0015FDCE17|nr:DUF1707 and FHA domain-containing protein [Streptacidiphilus sp. P02-A3a]QMU67629.1 FHA domain-containing protein [Streptacidiphilus sp. P02-A3a]